MSLLFHCYASAGIPNRAVSLCVVAIYTNIIANTLMYNRVAASQLQQNRCGTRSTIKPDWWPLAHASDTRPSDERERGRECGRFWGCLCDKYDNITDTTRSPCICRLAGRPAVERLGLRRPFRRNGQRWQTRRATPTLILALFYRTHARTAYLYFGVLYTHIV